jgi:hypothetical protein
MASLIDRTFHPACAHGLGAWRLGDCRRCGSEVQYCPWCPFFTCDACGEILPRPMPSEETYPYFPTGHLTDQQCWEIWTNYNNVCFDDIAVSARLPLATQKALWPFKLRGILIYWYRFGFTITHLGDLMAWAAMAVAEAQAREDEP